MQSSSSQTVTLYRNLLNKRWHINYGGVYKTDHGVLWQKLPDPDQPFPDLDEWNLSICQNLSI